MDRWNKNLMSFPPFVTHASEIGFLHLSSLLVKKSGLKDVPCYVDFKKFGTSLSRVFSFPGNEVFYKITFVLSLILGVHDDQDGQSLELSGNYWR